MSAHDTSARWATPQEIQTAHVELGERVGDMALDGTLIGTVVLIQRSDGQLEMVNTGVVLSHAIGMMSLGINMSTAMALGGQKK